FRPGSRRVPPVVEQHATVRMVRRPFGDELLNRRVAAMAVHDENAPEAAVRQTIEDIANDVQVRLDAQRDRTRIRAEIRGHPVRDHREHGYAEWFGRLGRDTLRQDTIDGEPEIPVLFSAAKRKHGAIVVPEIILDLHPVHVADQHGSSLAGGLGENLPELVTGWERDVADRREGGSLAM